MQQIPLNTFLQKGVSPGRTLTAYVKDKYTGTCNSLIPSRNIYKGSYSLLSVLAFIFYFPVFKE